MSKNTVSTSPCNKDKLGKSIKLTFEYSVPSDAFEYVNRSVQEKFAQLNPGSLYTAAELLEAGSLMLEEAVLDEIMLEHFAKLGNVPLVCVGTNSDLAKLYKLK